jgi:hypothetical protein
MYFRDPAIPDSPTIECFKGSIVYVARLACKPLQGAHDQVNREWSIPVAVQSHYYFGGMFVERSIRVFLRINTTCTIYIP